MVLPVVPMKSSPHQSPKVSFSPHLSPLVPQIVCKSIKIDSVVCFNVLGSPCTILVKFPRVPIIIRDLVNKMYTALALSFRGPTIYERPIVPKSLHWKSLPPPPDAVYNTVHVSL